MNQDRKEAMHSYLTISEILPNISPTIAELRTMPPHNTFYAASGPLRFTMTNDALFHIVFEANHEALKAFLCSLLHLKSEEISSIEVTNPIEFGNSVYTKSFVLDLKLKLNDKTVVNIE